MKTIFLILTILLIELQNVNSQTDRFVTGQVTDEQYMPLAGVSVVVVNTQRGTVTDNNGNYRIRILPGDKELTFSFIGMNPLTKKIGSSNTINVLMKPVKAELEEVVPADMSRKMMYGVSMAVPSTGSIFIRGYVQDGYNTENYSSIRENGFKNARTTPLSTFSIDVDNASYSNVRRFINQGNMPPADAVKIEEMVNYFKYDYPEPSGEHPFSVSSELGMCPWNEKNYLLHIGLKARSIDKKKLPASNLVFLIDVSGSMNMPAKLPLLKKAFTLLVNELRANDKVAIVVYAGAAGKVLDSTPGNKKDKILDAIENLQAGGSTAGGEGLKLAYEIARENYIEEGNNRIILATDGDFNVGVSSTGELEKMVEKERKSGVFMTVLGFGMGNIKDDKMETIADKGNGNYFYIDNIQEARKILISEFGGTLFTVAKDVKFQLEFNPVNVKSYRLIGYENRLLNDEDFNDDKKDAGEMGSGHTVTALYEIVPSSSGSEAPSVDPLKYQNNKNAANEKYSNELVTIKLRYKQPDGDKSRMFESVIADNPQKATSDDFRFSAAVAAFGMLLRNSEFKGSTSYEEVVRLAKGGKGKDDEGYRAEFINLVKNAAVIKLESE